MADTFARDVHCMLGLPFDVVDVAGAVRRIRDSVVSRQRCFLSTPNVNWLVSCLDDKAFRDSVIDSHLSIFDGMPLVWVAKFLGIPVRERVAGSQVFEAFSRDRVAPISVYFFGGPEGIAEAACQRLNADSEGMRCVGFECPGFGSVETISSEESIAKINASGADFVIVSLGAKKGQAWIERNRARLSVPVISHLGAVVNFVAGTITRAPIWMRRSGLEWLWRIKEEPELCRRYFSDGVSFLSLFVTRVIPHAWFLFRFKPSPHEIDSAAIEIQDESNKMVIRLRGAWVRENLKPLRECFARASLSGQDICLEMERVSYIDSAFVGLVLLLFGDCRRRARCLTLARSSETVRRVLRYSCVEYLLQV